MAASKENVDESLTDQTQSPLVIILTQKRDWENIFLNHIDSIKKQLLS